MPIRQLPRVRFCCAYLLFWLAFPFLATPTQTPRLEARSQLLDSARFTVRTSILMNRFERGAQPLFSPDRKYLALITTRGVLTSDQVESTLWIFATENLKWLLVGPATARKPEPKMLARLAGVPAGEGSNAYEPVITQVSWSDNSEEIYFLGSNSQGRRQLYCADVPTGRMRQLSPIGYDVRKFAVGGDTVVYQAATGFNQGFILGNRINSDASDVTGIPLASLLFPKKSGMQEYQYSRLGIIRARTARWVASRNGKPAVRLLNHLPYVLSLSPSHRSVVVLRPVMRVPETWDTYEPSLPYLRLRPNEPQTTSKFNFFRPTEYTLVDLATGRGDTLVRGPNAWALGSRNQNLAAWAPDGSRILLTNVFLPLDGSGSVRNSARLHHPCAAVVVSLATRSTSCVLWLPENAQRYLTDGKFDSARQLTITLANDRGEQIRIRYSEQDGRWQPTTTVENGKPAAWNSRLTAFTAAIKQDLNTPPALWIADRRTTSWKLVWDPNPQLSKMDLGEASVFTWRDRTGRRWTAGLIEPPSFVAGRSYPLVIQTHGFDEHEFISDGSFTTAFAARPLAGAGMLVLQMPTDHDHYVTPQEAHDQLLGYESAIDALAGQGMVDRGKVGIIGFSRTAYHVESALIQNPRLFRAATIADGVDESYLQYMLFALGRPADEAAEIYGCRPFGEGLEQWTHTAPGFHLDRVETPLRIEAIDPSSLLAEWETYSSLQAQGKPVTLIYFPDGDHVLQRPLERMASQQGNVDWFRFWLMDEEDSDPAKSVQYQRWRALRDRLVNEGQAKSQPGVSAN